MKLKKSTRYAGGFFVVNIKKFAHKDWLKLLLNNFQTKSLQRNKAVKLKVLNYVNSCAFLQDKMLKIAALNNFEPD